MQDLDDFLTEELGGQDIRFVFDALFAIGRMSYATKSLLSVHFSKDDWVRERSKHRFNPVYSSRLFQAVMKHRPTLMHAGGALDTIASEMDLDEQDRIAELVEQMPVVQYWRYRM